MNEPQTIDFIEKVREAVREQVQITVNGKIDKLQKEVSEIHVKVDLLKKDTDPIVDGQKAVKLTGKFIIWVGAISAAIYAFLKLFK